MPKKNTFSLNLFDANYNFQRFAKFCDAKICRPKVMHKQKRKGKQKRKQKRNILINYSVQNLIYKSKSNCC